MERDNRSPLVASEQIGYMCSELESEGYTLFTIDRVRNAAEFFEAVKSSFPLDPPISGRVNWDAFSDSLWSGLETCQSDRVALVVLDATEFQKNDSRAFDLLVECMVDAAHQVEDEKQLGKQADVRIQVVIGVS